jgi:DNA-binding NtrC family response regulator
LSTILIIEDEAIIRGALKRLLERAGHRLLEAGSIAEARLQPIGDCDLIIADLRLPGGAGTDILPHAGTIPVLIMTSYASVRSAVEAMKLGAADYIAKPFDHDEMRLTVERLIKQQTEARRQAALQRAVDEHYPTHGMIGRSSAMQTLFDRLARVAPTDTTVLICGESGTGKELVARAIHAQSRRQRGPFIPVNCAAIPEHLIESELFGHEKGAFTGADRTHHGLIEAAAGGTLLLDEIGELPLEAQARLLRVLQDGEIRRVGSTTPRHIDVRILAATHRHLQQRVEQGLFRADLLYRLQVVELTLPTLHERREDIADLARWLLHKSCQRLNRPPMQLSQEVIAQMEAYHWPGNVREMENLIERAVILGDGLTLHQLDLPIASHNQPQATDRLLSLDDYFINFVRQHEGQLNETELARALGMSRKTLWERRQRLNLPRNTR